MSTDQSSSSQTGAPATTRAHSEHQPRISAEHRNRPAVAAATLGIALAGALLLWALASALGGITLEAPAAEQTVGPVSITVATLLGGGAAWTLLSILRRHLYGLSWWTKVAVGVLVLSLAGPVLSGASGEALIVLEAMHLVVGSVLIVGLHRSAAGPETAGSTVADKAR